jgi:hypothetical protein
MRLAPSQIAEAAAAAGFGGESIAIAVAIALAESSGETLAHNAKPPDDSYGLWQINMLGSLGPARRAQFGLSANSDLFDPFINARAAYIVSNGGRNWRPWSTFTSGAYARYVGAVPSGVPQPEQGGVTGDEIPVEFQPRSNSSDSLGRRSEIRPLNLSGSAYSHAHCG